MVPDIKVSIINSGSIKYLQATKTLLKNAKHRKRKHSHPKSEKWLEIVNLGKRLQGTHILSLSIVCIYKCERNSQIEATYRL